MAFISHNGVETEGSPVVLIRILLQNAISKDIFGGNLYAYAPHILQFCYELAASNTPEPSLSDIIIAEFESINTGVRFQLFELPNGTAVNEADLDAAAVSPGPQADIDNLYWPTKLV
jgi:hypothetical protein